ncbi:Protein of unknown function DUF1997 [[Leptolyngbya] sp. PCC 7376]|uniref:DUF1997 domain-containing protein n=1 Tax=[Leptolyngbya] sp. PCC 7376 TaxID=111781 RepID=UPI00029EE5C9|nr:DUF1997 domain-containing protein [[Leptolyngbya] sp. PCC 7376]AFY36787.1 Protein of unknown function DUF1997 [[Leptolyngbya] sp. PCC 7376]
MDASESSSQFADSPNSVALPPMSFQTRFKGIMLMYAETNVVAEYLNRHEGWFHRCAHPMKVEPFTEKGYILTVGKFGNFGYEVEPKIAVLLDPPVETLYKMYNVPVPDEPNLGYAIDYSAEMLLSDTTWHSTIHDLDKAAKIFGDRPIPELITQVDWNLDLNVKVQFPKFIYKFPQKVLQAAGDRLLSSIVAQVSPRLTVKVQQDFHSTLNLPKPPKSASCFTCLRRPEQSESFNTAPTSAQKKEGIDQTNAPTQSIVL